MRPIVRIEAWPRRMPAEQAASYCGERTVGAFLQRVGTSIHRRASLRGTDDYGSRTISIRRSCRQSWRHRATSPRICDDDVEAAPLRHRKAVGP